MTGTSPLSDAQAAHLLQEAVREARRTLVARRFLGIYGPLGAGLESVRLETYDPDRDAEIDLIGRDDPSPIVAHSETYVRVPILYKDFILHWRDVELSNKLGAPIDASRAIRAAHFVADREDQLLFNGEPRFGIAGLLNAEGRFVGPGTFQTAPAPDRPDPPLEVTALAWSRGRKQVEATFAANAPANTRPALLLVDAESGRPLPVDPNGVEVTRARDGSPTRIALPVPAPHRERRVRAFVISGLTPVHEATL